MMCSLFQNIRRGRRKKRKEKSHVTYNEEDFKKAPHSFVFHRGDIDNDVKMLVHDIRNIMEPFTATKLKVFSDLDCRQCLLN